MSAKAGPKGDNKNDNANSAGANTGTSTVNETSNPLGDFLLTTNSPGAVFHGTQLRNEEDFNGVVKKITPEYEKFTLSRGGQLAEAGLHRFALYLTGVVARMVGDGLIVGGKLAKYATLGLANATSLTSKPARGAEVNMPYRQNSKRNFMEAHSVFQTYGGLTKGGGRVNLLESVGLALANAGVSAIDKATTEQRYPAKPKGHGKQFTA